jgi:carbon-monoxide dehydrogenase medium subunit
MIPPFALDRPTTVAEAAGLIDRYEDAAFYNGGTELTLLLKMGLAQFDRLVDLKGIAELRGIEQTDGALRIGASVTHAEIEHSPIVRERAPGLAHLERVLANVRVRNTGTLGGNLCFAEPHSDPAAFLVAWGAELELAGPMERRRRPVEGFVLGPLETDREPNEVLTAILLPDLPVQTTVVHEKIAFIQRPAASVAVRLGVEGGRFAGARVAVGSVGEVPELLTDAAAALDGADPADPAGAFAEAARIAAERCEPFEDLNGSVDYKRKLVGVLVRRALERAAREVTVNA